MIEKLNRWSLNKAGWFEDTDGTWYAPFPEADPDGHWLDAEKEGRHQLIKGVLQMALGATLIIIGLKLRR